MTTPTPRTDAVREETRGLSGLAKAIRFADLADALERELAAAQEALAAYRKRNEGNAIHRLHNLCDALDREAKDSPYSEESWQLQEEAYRAKCAELKEAQEANEQLRKERDAAFAMSRCECQSEECCRNLAEAQDARQRAEALAEEILPVPVKVGATWIAAGCKVETALRSIKSHIDAAKEMK